MREKKILVYGAANETIDPSFIRQGEALGEALAENGYSLVFGAGGSGMMGATARGVYRKKDVHGVSITGVVPNFFPDGELFDSCTELIRTNTMRERKKMMQELACAFVTTPGGIGTFEEFFEIITLIHLEQESKPMILANFNGYYDYLLEFLHFSGQQKFMNENTDYMFRVANTVEEVIALLDEVNI